jgi:hypothetical protein
LREKASARPCGVRQGFVVITQIAPLTCASRMRGRSTCRAKAAFSVKVKRPFAEVS